MGAACRFRFAVCCQAAAARLTLGHVEVTGKGKLVGRDTKRKHVVRLADVVFRGKAHGEKTAAVEYA